MSSPLQPGPEWRDSVPPPAEGAPPTGLPPSPFPGYFAPGQEPGVPAYVTPYGQRPLERPSALTVVIVVHYVLGGLTVISGLFRPELPGQTAFSGLLVVLAGLATVAVGAALQLRPGSGSQIAATVLSALWCLSCVGLVVSVPILLVLWRSEPTVQYFRAAEAERAARARL